MGYECVNLWIVSDIHGWMEVWSTPSGAQSALQSALQSLKNHAAASAVQCLVPGHYDSRQSEPGFEPATFRSIEDPLYHLGCSLSTKSDNSHRHIFCILCEEWQILLHLTEELWPAQRTEMYQYVSIILPPRWAKHCFHEPHNTHWIKAKKVLTA